RWRGMESDALLDAEAQKKNVDSSSNVDIGDTNLDTIPEPNSQEAELELSPKTKEQKKHFSIALRPRPHRKHLDIVPSKAWMITKAAEDREKEAQRLKELEAARIAAEERKEAEMKARRRSKTNFKLLPPGQVVLPPLCEDWENRVEQAMRTQ